VLDGFFQHNPTARGVQRLPAELKGFETLDMNVLEARAHRWRFNLKTGDCSESTLNERCAEFPMINGRHAGRRHTYSYNALCTPSLFAFNGLSKLNVDTGNDEVVEFPDGVFISETVMAPRVGSQAEDDGYLITFISDLNRDCSECLVFDAASPCDGPVAQIRLPERISSGTHATWAPAADL
jgi:carotenoid cleavage dioxygenase-like enzyme